MDKVSEKITENQKLSILMIFFFIYEIIKVFTQSFEKLHISNFIFQISYNVIKYQVNLKIFKSKMLKPNLSLKIQKSNVRTKLKLKIVLIKS